MAYTVYKHTTPNGKVYIGITRLNPIKRWQNGGGYKNNSHFSAAIQQYGWDNIRHEILYCELPKDAAEAKEIELIAKYRSNNRKYGYNIANGGNSFGMHGEETRKKIGEANKGQTAGAKHWHYGAHWSEVIRKKMSKSHSKKVKCVETGIVYDSAKEAGEKIGVDRHNIASCGRGAKGHLTAGGFRWEYVKE